MAVSINLKRAVCPKYNSQTFLPVSFQSFSYRHSGARNANACLSHVVTEFREVTLLLSYCVPRRWPCLATVYLPRAYVSTSVNTQEQVLFTLKVQVMSHLLLTAINNDRETRRVRGPMKSNFSACLLCFHGADQCSAIRTFPFSHVTFQEITRWIEV